MPIYQFICECGQNRELLRTMEERDLPVVCIKCGKVMKRKPAFGVNFTFKAPTQDLGNGTVIKPRASYNE